MSYTTIKALASERGVSITSLLALSEDNDPFFCGRVAAVADAEWFRDLWQRFGFGAGVHLRRIHYRCVSEGTVALRTGQLYTNTEQCWDRLQIASKAARYLGLVDPAAFVDRRSPDPHIFRAYRESAAAPMATIPEPSWFLPEISAAFDVSLDLPEPEITGYDYSLADQGYHVILWIEKSTMDDELEPLCREYGIDLVTGAGFSSVTSVIAVLQRLQATSARIFYVSDFDPAGQSMPVGVARQLEFWREQYAPDVQIGLTPLALTREQVIRYALPRVPIKDADSRKRGFEDRHGEGAVELDALEALHPGELARLVEAAITPYIDIGLEARLSDAEAEAADLAAVEWDEKTEAVAEELAAIGVEAKRIAQRFKPRARALAREFDAAMKPLRQRLDLARQALLEQAQNLELELPERPEAEEAQVDESGWLFDSDRAYFDQLGAYTRHRNGHGAEVCGR